MIVTRAASDMEMPPPAYPATLLTMTLLTMLTAYQSSGLGLACTSTPLTPLRQMPPPLPEPERLPWIRFPSIVTLPEPLLSDPYQDPARSAELADSVSMAALLLLERLSPLERSVFVLREVFGFGFDDIAIVPSRRTRDPDDVDISWQLDAFRFELPMMGSAMDGAISPATAIEIGRLGGVGVLNLEGLWSRYADPEPYLEEIAELEVDKATRRMQEIYLEPIKPELIGRRVEEMKEAGIVTAASLTPQRVK